MSHVTNTLWHCGTHLDITQHADGTFELGLTHADDVGIDDGNGDGYSLKNLTAKDLTRIATALLAVATDGVTK